MNLVKDILTVHQDQSKANYWKAVQANRNKYESKWFILMKRALNKQFQDLADRVRPDNYRSDFQIDGEIMEKAYVSLYKEVGAGFARVQFGKGGKPEMLHKDEWLDYMGNYAKTKAGQRITSVNKNSRDLALRIIRTALEVTVAEGLGADETASAIKKALLQQGVEMNQWRALRIARTEIVTASNIGALLGAKESGYPMQKFWISTYDDRTRDTHRNIEAQNPKAMDEGFRVGSYLMECPGDPDAGPEETINCRCTVAFEVIM